MVNEARPRVNGRRNKVLRQFLALDARSLAAFRIVASLILLHDLAGRWPFVELLYSNVGPFPDHYMLFLDPRPHFSGLFGLGTPLQVRGFFLAGFAIYLSLLVGFHTRLSQVLALLFTLSVHTRAPMAAFGLDPMASIFLTWTLFVPLGRRWSIDAWLGRAERSDEISSIAGLGIAVQLAGIYIFAALDKTGVTWREATAIHNTVWQDSIVKPIGLWARTFPPWLLAAASDGSKIVEFVGGVLLLSPWRMRLCRGLALLMLAGLHLGIFVMIHVGGLSPIMWASYLLLVPGEAWDAMHRWLSARGESSGRVASLLARRHGSPPTTPRPGARLRRVEARAREVLAGVFLFDVVWSMAAVNEGIPEQWRVQHIPALRSFNDWLTVGQGWGFFSPDAPPDDGWWVIDGVTADGRHIDPLTGTTPLREIPIGYGTDRSHIDYAYTRQIRSGQWQWHVANIDAWIRRSHTMDGRSPEDAIVSYVVYNLVRDDPPMGSSTPPPWRLERLFAGEVQPPPSPAAGGTP